VARRADERWEKGTPFNMFGDVSACGDVARSGMASEFLKEA
jgi:hypothetical protein